MKNFLFTLLAGLSFVGLSAVAEAGGGGGTKNNGQIRVVNHGTGTLIVFLNAGSEGNTDLLDLGSGVPVTADLQTQFNTTGGRTVTANGNTTFTNLVAGDYTLTAEFLSTSGGTTTTGEPTTTTVHVNKGQTVTVTYTGNSSGATATVSPTSAGVSVATVR
jgi:hypothetical protein